MTCLCFRLAEFLIGGDHISPAEFHNHDHHYGYGSEYEEDASRPPVTPGDLSEDEQNLQSPSFIPARPVIPPLPPAPAPSVPLTPPASADLICPYPLTPMTPETPPTRNTLPVQFSDDEPF